MPPKRRSRAKKGDDSATESHSVSPALNPLEPPQAAVAAAAASAPPLNNNDTSTTVVTDAAQQQMDAAATLHILVDAAATASKVFDGSFTRTSKKLNQTVSVINAVAASAASSVDHRNALLQTCSELAADNRVLKATCAALSEATKRTTTTTAAANSEDANAEQQHQTTTTTTTVMNNNSLSSSHKSDQCIQKTYDTLRFATQSALESATTAQVAAMKGRSDTIACDVDRQRLLLNLRSANEELEERNIRIAELEEALHIAVASSGNSGGVSAAAAQQQQIDDLKATIRTLESGQLFSSSSSSSDVSLATSLRYLDKQGWSVSELVQRYRTSEADTQNLRQQVRDQAADISGARTQIARLKSEGQQTAWKIGHLENLLARTGASFHRNFERDVLQELNDALTSKAASCVLLDDAQKKLESTRAALSELEVEHEMAKKMLDQSEMLNLFKKAEDRRDALVEQYKERFDHSQLELQTALTANDEFKMQYDALKGLVMALQSSTESLSSKLRNTETLLRQKTTEAKELSVQLAAATTTTTYTAAAQQGSSGSGISTTGSGTAVTLRQEPTPFASFGGFGAAGSVSTAAATKQQQQQQQQSSPLTRELIDSFTRLEKAAVQLVSRVAAVDTSSTSSPPWGVEAASDDAAATASPSAATPATTTAPLLNFVLSSFDEALQTAEKARVKLLGEITHLSVELERVRTSHHETSTELMQCQQRLQQAEANIERSSGAFTSAVLQRDTDDSELRIAALQRSVSKLEEIEHQNKLQADQITLLAKACSTHNEDINALSMHLATAEGRLLASVLREEGARRQTIVTSEFAELQQIWLLASLSASAASGLEMAAAAGEDSASPLSAAQQGGAPAASTSEGGESQTRTTEDASSSSSSSSASPLSAVAPSLESPTNIIKQMSERIREASAPLEAMHQRLVDSVDSAIREEQENETAATLSLSKLCSVLDSVLSYWRSAAAREQQLSSDSVSATTSRAQKMLAADRGAGADTDAAVTAADDDSVGKKQGGGAAISEEDLNELKDQLTVESGKREALEAELSQKRNEVTVLEQKNQKLTALVAHYTQGDK